jgi:hypothetical protein
MGPLPIGETFNRFLEVKDPEGNIAMFTVEAFTPAGGTNAGDLGIDEVSVNFTGGGKPDFFITTTNQVLPVVQGQVTQVLVKVVRLNGSSGKIDLQVENLPEGVSAAPAEIEPGKSSGLIELTANSGAPDTNFEPRQARIVARPFNSNVGPGPRTANLSLRVAADLKLSSGGIGEDDVRKVLIEAPDCAQVDVPLAIDRDIAMSRDVALSVEGEGGGLPQGVSAEFLPSATVPPGGSLRAERTLRLRSGPTSPLGIRTVDLFLEGSAGPGNPPRTLEMTMVRAARATVATSTPGSGRGVIPHFLKEGSLVQVHGLGFCPGTEVEVGNELARVPAALIDDHTIEFRVPRNATSGRLRIDPPGFLSGYRTEDSLIVDNSRNSAAFPFENYAFGALGIDEFAKAFGDEEIFFHINPCWPFADCGVQTGFLSPMAAIDWGWMNPALRNTNGHCFGIGLGVQLLESGKEPRRKYVDANVGGNPRSAFEMSTPQGPGGILNDFLDAMQARQFSEEFLAGWVDRSRSMESQLQRLEREFARGREPMITLEHFGNGHAVLAYDMERTADGAEIHVYDNQAPFTESEELNGLVHDKALRRSTITFFNATYSWSFPIGGGAFWTNTAGNGSLWVVPTDLIPTDPSLPGLGTKARALLEYVGLGSARGAVSSRAVGVRADFLPTGEVGAPPGNGMWVSDDPKRPLRVSVEGVKRGRYTQSYAAPGFAAAVPGVATAKGVRDLVWGDGDAVGFEGGMARDLTIQLARDSSPTTSTAATLETHASARGTDTAGLGAGGALTYAHDGAPTGLRFTLTAVRRNGGPSTFVSPPVAVGRGERLRVEPLDRDLRRVRVEIRAADGRRTTRVLRSRGGAPARLRVGKPAVSRRRVSVRYTVAGLRPRAVVGAVLRLMRGDDVVARHAGSRRTANGARRIVWRPRRHLAPGHYRLLVDLRLVSTGARGSTVSGSVSVHRARAIRVR